jgi:hypothetical protein
MRLIYSFLSAFRQQLFASNLSNLDRVKIARFWRTAVVAQ